MFFFFVIMSYEISLKTGRTVAYNFWLKFVDRKLTNRRHFLGEWDYCQVSYLSLYVKAIRVREKNLKLLGEVKS